MAAVVTAALAEVEAAETRPLAPGPLVRKCLFMVEKGLQLCRASSTPCLLEGSGEKKCVLSVSTLPKSASANADGQRIACLTTGPDRLLDYSFCRGAVGGGICRDSG